jgi:hypothetical protein
MFSDNEIHRIAGHLYLATGRDDIEIVLGDRIVDIASGTKRDVDIVVLTSGNTAMMGVEIKNERRPLDTPMVEGLCQKLCDMPSIARRQIVSSAGYTAPALRKAAAHRVECLTIRAGPLPKFDSVDLTRLHHMDLRQKEWGHVSITLIEAVQLDPSLAHRLQALAASPTTLIMVGGSTIEIAELKRRILKGVLDTVQPHDNSSDLMLDQTFNFDQPVELIFEDQLIVFQRARVMGVVRVVSTRVPLDKTLYLTGPDGKPVAACVLIDLDQGLMGLSAAPGVNALRLFTIPAPVRGKRPFKEAILCSPPPSPGCTPRNSLTKNAEHRTDTNRLLSTLGLSDDGT